MTIEKLQTKITDIENSVNEDMSKEELYDKLIIAYQLQKDIIVLQQGNIPIKEDKALEVRLRESDEALNKLRGDYALLETKLDILDQEYLQLEEAITEYKTILTQINSITAEAINQQ